MSDTRQMSQAEQREYMAGRRFGVADACRDAFEPCRFAGECYDFRQGYVDGWEEMRDARQA